MNGDPVGDDSGVAYGPLTFRHTDYDPAQLAHSKGMRRISVCVPARDEETTLGPIISSVREALTARGGGVDLVDEVLVVDDGSRDGTADVALSRGARLVSTGRRGQGKGEAMRVALAEAEGDLIVFVDADVTNFGPHFVSGLVGPLVQDEGAALVKAFYERPLDGRPNEGGRVTELVARPLIDLLFPHLRGVRQPLAGETAAPRTVLEKTGLASGYGVELGLLVDVAERFGVESLRQVDLGVRVHRNRPLSELSPQARDVIRAALERSGGSHLPRGPEDAERSGRDV